MLCVATREQCVFICISQLTYLSKADRILQTTKELNEIKLLPNHFTPLWVKEIYIGGVWTGPSHRGQMSKQQRWR